MWCSIALGLLTAVTLGVLIKYTIETVNLRKAAQEQVAQAKRQDELAEKALAGARAAEIRRQRTDVLVALIATRWVAGNPHPDADSTARFNTAINSITALWAEDAEVMDDKRALFAAIGAPARPPRTAVDEQWEIFLRHLARSIGASFDALSDTDLAEMFVR
jgi:predicted outer membrane lipoprotein